MCVRILRRLGIKSMAKLDDEREEYENSQDEVCHHGVRLTDDCEACELEILDD